MPWTMTWAEGGSYLVVQNQVPRPSLLASPSRLPPPTNLSIFVAETSSTVLYSTVLYCSTLTYPPKC
jgi:hypothetical protein